MDFNVTEYKKFIDIVSDSRLQLTFHNLFVELRYSVKEEYPQSSGKAIKNMPPFQGYMCVRLGFLHILQPKQHYRS